MIYQKSLDEGVIPENWKEANLSPISKKGIGQFPQFYVPVPCKVMDLINSQRHAAALLQE